MSEAVMKIGILLMMCGLALPAMAQEADYGFTLPATLSAGGMYSHAWEQATPTAGPLEPGFQLMLYPSFKLGEHWYAYGAVDINLSPYNYFQDDSATNRLKVYVIQAFLAYNRTKGSRSLTIKAGQLSSAFGSFPLRYDDMQNPMLGAPATYGAPSYGNFPVTLYGLPGVEIDASLGRLDTRLQLTNSSPANPKNMLQNGQSLNWTAGAGYTIRQGFRVGMSVDHGAYLQVGRFLLPSENSSQWPFTAVGVDGQWARGRVSINGEWQRFYYLYPRYIMSPVIKYGYLEPKVVLNPRLYVACRFGPESFSDFQTINMAEPGVLTPNRQVMELAFGYRINHAQLVKVGYEWPHRDGTLNTHNNIFGVQLVTSINAISKAFH
jgi:hypothetical protein